jgi:hypothetical protein
MRAYTRECLLVERSTVQNFTTRYSFERPARMIDMLKGWRANP